MDLHLKGRKQLQKPAPIPPPNWGLIFISIGIAVNSLYTLFTVISFCQNPHLISVQRLQHDQNLALSLGIVRICQLTSLARVNLDLPDQFYG